MPIQLNSPGWRLRRAGASRGAARDGAVDLPGLPPEFLTDASRVAEEVVLEPAPATRGREAAAGGLDLSYDLEAGQTAVLVVRHPSGALTFHLRFTPPAGGCVGPRRCGSRSAYGRPPRAV